jgi:hypothetical protein
MKFPGLRSAGGGDGPAPSPQPQIQVFLSHSSHTEEANDVLEAVAAALRDAGDRPLVDRTHIPLGEDIPSGVSKLIRVCDAAVFLISESALDVESWVFGEARELKQKMDIPGFQAIPVLVGVTRDQLVGRWDQTGLAFRNAVIGGDAEEIARKVVKGLGRTHERLRAGPVAAALQVKLSGVPEAVLRRAAAPVGDAGVASPDSLDVALLLLGGDADGIVAVAEALAVASEDAAFAVLNLALPFTWVNADAARALDAAVRSGRLAAVNATRAWTPECYLTRGSADYPPWKVEPVDLLAGELPGRPDAEAHDTLEWRDGAIGRNDGPPSARREPTVIAVDCRRLDDEIVREYEKYAGVENVGVVFLAHGHRWEDVSDVLRRRLELLTPELDPESEAEARRRYDKGCDEVEWRAKQHARLTTGRR